MFQLESYFNTEDQHLLEALGNSINSSLAIAERFDRLKRLEKLAGQIQYPDGQEAALFLLLTALTHGDDLGYNRAIAFLVDKEDAPSRLTCRFAVGQLDMEAWHGAVASTDAKLDLHQLLEDFEKDRSRFLDTAIMRAWSRWEVPLTDLEHQKIAYHAVAESSTTKYITDSLHENDLFKNFALGDFALTPIRVGNRLRGIIYCDNRFTGNTINRFESQILDVFAGMAGAILDAAAVPNKLREANEEAWRLFSQPAAHRLGTETNIIDGEVYYHGLPALQQLEEQVGPGHPASGEMREALAVIRRSASRLVSAT